MGVYSPNIIADSFLCCARHNGQGEAVIFGDRRMSWSQLVPRVLRVANALIGLGVKKGDRVAFMFHNTPEFLEVNFGIQCAGAVPVPMNFRFTSREIAFQGNHCDARVFLYDSIWADAVEAAVSRLEKIAHYVRRGEGALARALDYEQLLADVRESDPAVTGAWSDEAVMIYTGGTTGLPKGVMLTFQGFLDMFVTLYTSIVIRGLGADSPPDKHRHVVEALSVPAPAILGPILRTGAVKKWLKSPRARVALEKRFRRLFSDPVIASKDYWKAKKTCFPSMPLFHVAAYAPLMFGALTGGYIFVLPDSLSFDPALILSLVEKEGIFNMSNVPTGWTKLVGFAERDRYDLSSLRITSTGGGVCPASLKKQILALCPNALLLDYFGQTEMTPVTSFRLDLDARTIEERSVGRPIVEVRVVDDKGDEVPRGETGEILYRSNTVMKGYYKDEDRTREVLRDGWFSSGDLGYLDENNEIRVVDRKKECINTGGEKVFPLEVEEVLNRHRKVQDSCVIGVPNPEWGNIVRAVIQLGDGEKAEPEEMINFCRSELAGYKIPRSVVFVPELPRSPVGKMLREKVREAYGRP